jgi:VWFA-related protein
MGMRTYRHRVTYISSCRYPFLSLALLSFVLPPLSAQTSQPPAPNSDVQTPAIKSEVRIVLLDVVVTQGKGGPVTRLHQGDFQVAEDGKPQTISYFEEHAGAAPKAVALPPMSPDVYTNYPTMKTTDSVNVLLLDALNTPAADQGYAHAQMVKYLDAAVNAPTGAPIAIFALGSRLRIVRGFAADTSGLAMALNDPKSGTGSQFVSQLASPNRKLSEYLGCTSIRSPIASETCKEFLAQENGERDSDRVGMTLQAFQEIARYLAPIPGRKNLMWVSGSFPIHFFPDSGARGKFLNPHESDAQQTADLLTADQVAVYPILATGLDADNVYDPNNLGKPVEANQTDRGFNQIAMETLARDTGGRAFYNSNGLSEAMAEAIDDGSHYYTLTYTPTNGKMDGKYRHIQLKCVDGEYKLAYRRGYYAEDAKFTQAGEAKRKTDLLLPLVGFGMPDFAQILYKVRVQPLAPQPKPGAKRAGSNADLKEPVVRYGLDFAISPQDLRLQATPDGVRHGSIVVTVIAYDPGGKPLNMTTKTSEIVLEARVYAAVQQAGLQVHKEIDVPQGEVFLRTGVYDLNSGKAGSLGVPLSAVAASMPFTK